MPPSAPSRRPTSDWRAPPAATRPSPWLLTAAGRLLAALVGSGFAARDRGTWMLEVAPVVVALPLLAWGWRRFPFTPLLYAAIFGFSLVLIVGGIYGYAHVPWGWRVADWIGSDRNPYDKLGHLLQGIVPALAAREVLQRGGWLRADATRMAGFLAVCVAMAVSACYELVEWVAALALGQGADEFLGTQGYEWDTQSDMGWALLGALAAVLLLGRWHRRQMARMGPAPAPASSLRKP